MVDREGGRGEAVEDLEVVEEGFAVGDGDGGEAMEAGDGGDGVGVFEVLVAEKEEEGFDFRGSRGCGRR